MPRRALPYSEKKVNTLITNYHTLSAAGEEIPADLLYWLSVKAPDKFGPNGPLVKAGYGNKKPYSKQKLTTLETKYSLLTTANEPVPHELMAELVSRLPNKYTMAGRIQYVRKKSYVDKKLDTLVLNYKDLKKLINLYRRN